MAAVTVELEDFEADCLAACALVGAEGCPDRMIADAAYKAVEKIKEALDDGR